MAREGTEDNDIGHCVTADAVTAVDAANHFTCGKSARNRLLTGVQYRGFRIDGHATHRVVNPRGDANRMVRAFINRRAQRGSAAKIIVMLFFNKAIIAFSVLRKAW